MENKFAKVENIYLDYVNNFLTIGRFAEYYSLSVERAQRLLGIARQRREHRIELAFVVHGTYSCGYDGYEVQLNKSCDGARLRSYDSNGVATVTDWFEIETIVDPNFEPDGDNKGDEFISVIDPDGHNIPLNEVFRA